MKYFKILVIPLLLIVALSISCERDDICPESTLTTPRLIIDFYDVSNQEDSKNVFGLLVGGIGNEFALPEYSVVTTANVILPLKTDDNSTQFAFIQNYSINDNGTPEDTSDDFQEGNQDIITIKYSREQIYVSRACGYKTIFKNVTLTIEPDSDNWIKSKLFLNDNQSVEDETETHFNLFH